MKMNKMWGILAGCIFCTALFPCNVKANNETQDIMNQLVRASPGWDKDCSDFTIQLSQDDAWKLMKLAQAEAGTEGLYGQYLVMRVVINRMYSEDFPDTISEIISQKGQFETYAKGIYQTTEPTVDSHLALAFLEKNVDADEAIIGFETKSNGSALLEYFDLAYSYGNHSFYVNKD